MANVSRAHRWSIPGTAREHIRWVPADVVVLAANLALATLVAVYAARFENIAVYLGLHAAIAVGVIAAARYDTRTDNAISTFVHLWLPIVFVIGVYFELTFLIPHIHPIAGAFPYDHALQAIDVRLLGDPAAFIARLAWPPLSDALTLCYLLYYPYAVALPILTYARSDDAHRAFHEVVAVLLCAMMLCFAGYLLVPAIGPHRLFDATRAAALDGYWLADRGYAMMLRVPYEPPDAFPSGHALIGLVVPVLAWRHAKSLFPAFLVIGVGIVLATVYLRFHYLTDVAASVALAPLAIAAGRRVARR